MGYSLLFMLWVLSYTDGDLSPFFANMLLRTTLSGGSAFFVLMPEPFHEGQREGGAILEYDEEINDITAEWFSLDGDEDYDDQEIINDERSS